MGGKKKAHANLVATVMTKRALWTWKNHKSLINFSLDVFSFTYSYHFVDFFGIFFFTCRSSKSDFNRHPSSTSKNWMENCYLQFIFCKISLLKRGKKKFICRIKHIDFSHPSHRHREAKKCKEISVYFS